MTRKQQSHKTENAAPSPSGERGTDTVVSLYRTDSSCLSSTPFQKLI